MRRLGAVARRTLKAQLAERSPAAERRGRQGAEAPRGRGKRGVRTRMLKARPAERSAYGGAQGGNGSREGNKGYLLWAPP